MKYEFRSKVHGSRVQAGAGAGAGLGQACNAKGCENAPKTRCDAAISQQQIEEDH